LAKRIGDNGQVKIRVERIAAPLFPPSGPGQRAGFSMANPAGTMSTARI